MRPIMVDMSQSQMGDTSLRDIAGRDVNTIVTNIDKIIALITGDIERLEARISSIEGAQSLYAQERQALTRALTVLATENKSVRDIQEMLESQIKLDRAERTQRRIALDVTLIALVCCNIGTIVLVVVLTRRLLQNRNTVLSP